MSAPEWNDVFRLPQTALAGDRRIPKTVLVRQALLTKTEQKTLSKVGALSHYATVQKSTTYIPPALDEERDIQSVVFLTCKMAGSSASSEVVGLVHRCFPNPTVLLAEGLDTVCISVSITRRSLAEKGAVVVDRVESTGPIDLTVPQLAPFVEELAFERLPQYDLLSYLEGLGWCVRRALMTSELGFYPQCAKDERACLEELVSERSTLAENVTALKRRRGEKDLTLNETARLRMELHGVERELADVDNRIKELCHA